MRDTALLTLPHQDVLVALEPFVAENLSLLLPVDRAWQPTDYLPDLTADNWRDQLAAFREPAQAITDELLVCLVGNMITEEALPNYAVSLNLIAQDSQGTSDRPWARWLRGWTAEENRHGDLLNTYLRLTGRVDMASIERTIHHLLYRGFNPKAGDDPYRGLIYTSFQERATSIAHNNIARLVSAQGETALAAICRRIAGDEVRHETFYQTMMGKVIQADPDGAMLAIKAMLKTMIVMPASLMTDGRDPNLFEHFAAVAQRIGVYTIRDYAQIIAHLIRTWKLAEVSVTGQAAKAQDYLCRQPARYEMLAEAVEQKVAQQHKVQFGWIFDRQA